MPFFRTCFHVLSRSALAWERPRGLNFSDAHGMVNFKQTWMAYMRSIRLKKLQTEVRVGGDHAEHKEEACEGAAGPVVRIVHFNSIYVNRIGCGHLMSVE